MYRIGLEVLLFLFPSAAKGGACCCRLCVHQDLLVRDYLLEFSLPGFIWTWIGIVVVAALTSMILGLKAKDKYVVFPCGISLVMVLGRKGWCACDENQPWPGPSLLCCLEAYPGCSTHPCSFYHDWVISPMFDAEYDPNL